MLWDIIDNRNADGRADVPLIIIAHSLGGTLAKQLFTASSPSRNSSPEANQLHSMIKGYVFFGTINVGGPPQEMLPLLRLHRGVHSILRFVNVKPGPADLAGFFDQMASINNDFDTSGGLQIPSVCFYESKPTVIGGFNVCSPPELP